MNRHLKQNYFRKEPTKKELKGFIKLADDEIEEWVNFRYKCQSKLNNLTFPHLNPKH